MALLGAGIIPVGNATLISGDPALGHDLSAWTYLQVCGTSIGIENGIVLSTGDVENAEGPNESEGSTGFLSGIGDADLNALISPERTEDTTSLEFDFISNGSDLYINYVFASEEYLEHVFDFNDAFAFFLNGENIALVPGTTLPVTIDTINDQVNSDLYNDNAVGTGAFNDDFGLRWFYQCFDCGGL